MKRLLTMLALAAIVLTGCTSKNIMSEYPNFDKKDHHFVEADYSNVISDLENKKEGLYYVGYAQCPWCVALVPEMEAVLTETNQKITYINVKDKRFADNADLKNRYQAFDKSLPQDLQSGGTVPFVIAIDANGNVATHNGTVDGHNGQTPLTENQKKFLNIRLKSMFSGITTK